MNLNSTSISLYIHIPFCTTKCKYCDFYSETRNFDRIPEVITQIISQLNKRYYELNTPQIKTVFIGGGTPSMLPNRELARLLQAVAAVAPEPLEWSIESNPESITQDFLLTCQKYGVNRLSIGIQSVDKQSLEILGRNSGIETVKTALSLVKKFWLKQFSLDFISSVPGQTKDMIYNDISFALKYSPDHISFYALSLEEGTVLEDEVSKGVVEELEDKESEDNWLYGRRLLKESGYNNYEVSNYTKNSPCLHNINYWELKPYLGIGPGAVSTLIDKENRIVRVTNKKSISTYLEGEESNWGEDREYLSPKDFLEDYIIMGLRLKNGIDKRRFHKIFNLDIVRAIPITRILEKEGLLKNNDYYYNLTEKGFDIMNSILIRILESVTDVNIYEVNWFY